MDTKEFLPYLEEQYVCWQKMHHNYYKDNASEKVTAYALGSAEQLRKLIALVKGHIENEQH